MAYFEMFPSIYYSAKGDGKYTVMKDLLSRVKLIAKVKENILGFKYYGDVNLHWSILVANDIVDYYDEWPMSVQRFEEFVKEKYDNPQGIHHYEITQTSGDANIKIDVGMNTTDYPSATAISNYQYEDSLQEKKRQIRLISPDFIDQFVKEFERKMNEAS